MAKYRITAPDGNSYEITAPDDATQEQVMAYAQQNHAPSNNANDSDFARMITNPQATSRAELLRREDAERYSPTKGMSGIDRFRAGFAKSFVDAGEGIQQLATDSAARHSQTLAAGLKLVGMDTAADAVVRHGVMPANREQSRVQAKIDERRRLDAPLMDTGAGIAGNITGHATQIVGPGIALRGTAAGAALLPRTVAGNALQGAVVGGLQPIATGESRTGKAAIGGTVGALVPAALKAPGALRRVVATAVRPERAAAKEAVRVIQKEAASPNIGVRPELSLVPGATRSLFDETLDPGIARLETRSRSVGAGWADRDSANNIARVNALRGFAGDEAGIAAAESARWQATNGLRSKAFAEGEETAQQAATAGFSVADNVAGLRSQFEGIASGQGGRGAVKRAIQDVIADLDEAAPTVQGLYNVRKSIGDLLSGKAGTDKAYAKAASAELMQMRDMLDAELVNLAPSFEQYLQSFRGMSGPINRMQTGQALIERGSGMLDPVTGEARLMPAQFGRAARDLDAVVQSATGFNKAKAADILQPSDVATINAVNDDLARQAARLVRGAGGGSHTASQLEVGKKLAVRSLARAIPAVGAAVEYLEQQGAQRLEKALERVLMNPDEYRAIARLVSREDRRLLEQALVRIAGPGSRSAVTAGSNSRQPVAPVAMPSLAE